VRPVSGHAPWCASRRRPWRLAFWVGHSAREDVNGVVVWRPLDWTTCQDCGITRRKASATTSIWQWH